MPKAIVIIPTYNEKDNIGDTIQALAGVFANIKSWQMKVLVVDDSSPDGTASVVKALQKKLPFVELLVNSKKSGLGGAYLSGMKHAFSKLGADLVFEFDADLSHDPKKIPAFLKRIDQGNDMVLGSRYIAGGSIPKDWGLHRKIMSVAGNLFINLLMMDFSIRDWTTGFRAIRKNVYEMVEKELHSERFSGYTFQIGFLHKALRAGFRVSEVPFEFRDRVVGSSKIGPEYIKNTLLYLMKVRIKEILAMRVVKFAMVGAFGALVQLVALQLWRMVFSSASNFVLANFLSIETAIVSNFIWSNLWTFKDRKLTAEQIPLSFLTFNVSSVGSIIIQTLIAIFTSNVVGLWAIFTLPVIGYVIDTGVVSAVVGILLGMFWNFFAYNTFIWKKKKN